jgi:membrane protein DedA with SNARE-associated domain
VRRTTRRWLIDGLAGALLGGIAGAVAAVNVVIYAGIEGGYEANLAEVFRQSVPVGIAAVALLVAGPIVGVLVARRRRRRRRA